MMSPGSRPTSDEIRTIHFMIHMIYHRNKNQHGGAKWWKWLRMLKSSIYSLLMAIENDASGDAVTVYEDYLQRRLIPKCYLAFSAVVADAQFSALGTVLVAIIARIANVIGKEETSRSSTIVGDEGTRSLAGTISDQIPDIGEPVRRANDAPALSRPQASDDLTGVRSEFLRSRSTSNDQASRPKPAGNTQRRPSTHKNRRRANAIDDLFSTIL